MVSTIRSFAASPLARAILMVAVRSLRSLHRHRPPLPSPRRRCGGCPRGVLVTVEDGGHVNDDDDRGVDDRGGNDRGGNDRGASDLCA
jgi:hypothetical protein